MTLRTQPDFHKLLNQLKLSQVVMVAKQAGDAIMDVYGDDVKVELKGDGSPLTVADKRAHTVIVRGLGQIGRALEVDIPILSEEGLQPDYATRKDWGFFWLVDPLDGTKEFIAKNGEFTVNIALVYESKPVLGVVYAPVLGQMYSAKQGAGAFKNDQRLPLDKADGRTAFKIVVSRSHLTPQTRRFIDSIHTAREKKTVAVGSSLKICLVAEGAADLYPRLGPTMEWDIAAAHAVCIEAGVPLRKFKADEYGEQSYNKQNLTNDWFVVGAVKP